MSLGGRARGRRVGALVVVVVLLVAGLGGLPAARAATVNIPAGDVAALIAAINAANLTPEPDEIVLAAGTTYTLNAIDNTDVGGASGLPLITSELTIVGNGATLTRSTADGTPAFRSLRVESTGTLTLQQLTISNGTTLDGGGIFNNGTLTLTNSTINGNSAEVGGGGIFNIGMLTLTDSTVNGNNAGFEGGGILNFETLTLTNSTVSGNSADVIGGGIDNSETLTITNSTVSGNSARDGGGIYGYSGTLTLTNSTVSGNSATSIGGGIINFSTFDTLSLTNTLVAGNTAPTAPDIDGPASGTFNLIGNGTNLTGLTNGTDGNQVGTGQAPIDPLLGPLADNGGPTQTHLPQPGSPALDAAGTAAGPASDQRGISRPQGAASDIGAVEVEVALTHAELCALTQAAVRQPSVARSACVVLELARVAEQQGIVVIEQAALSIYRLQIRSAQSRRYVSPADAAELIAWSRTL